MQHIVKGNAKQYKEDQNIFKKLTFFYKFF